MSNKLTELEKRIIRLEVMLEAKEEIIDIFKKLLDDKSKASQLDSIIYHPKYYHGTTATDCNTNANPWEISNSQRYITSNAEHKTTGLDNTWTTMCDGASPVKG